MVTSISREFMGIAATLAAAAVGDTVMVTVVMEQIGTGEVSHTR